MDQNILKKATYALFKTRFIFKLILNKDDAICKIVVVVV